MLTTSGTRADIGAYGGSGATGMGPWLDSDAEAVQLVTIHGSKGLQYPVVYLPTLWNRYTGREPVVPLYHDDDGRRCRDVGGPSAFRREAVARHWREDAGESLRSVLAAPNCKDLKTPTSKSRSPSSIRSSQL